MLVHRLVTSPDAAKYLPFGESKLRQLVDLFGGSPLVKNYVLEDATITVEVYSRDSGSVTVEGGFAYITIGTEVNPPSYVAKAQSSFKRTFKRFKSVFVDTDANNAPALIEITGSKAITLQLSGQKIKVYRVKRGGSSKNIYEIAYGNQPSNVGEGVTGAFAQIGKKSYLVFSMNYYYTSGLNTYYRALISRSTDSGAGWIDFFPVSIVFGGAADQYTSGPKFLGNDVTNFLSGYAKRDGSDPDEPVLFRTEDDGDEWTGYNATNLFSWVSGAWTNAQEETAYQDFVKFAEMIPVGNDTVLLVAYHSTPSGTTVHVHKSTDNGLSFNTGAQVADDWVTSSALGVGAALIGVQNGAAYSIALTNDFGATWVNRAAPFAQAAGYTLVATPPKTDEGKIDLDKLELVAPFYDTDGYYVYYTKDGGLTWTKGGLIAKTAVTPTVLGKANFSYVTALSKDGSFAFSNLYDNAGAPLQ